MHTSESCIVIVKMFKSNHLNCCSTFPLPDGAWYVNIYFIFSWAYTNGKSTLVFKKKGISDFKWSKILLLRAMESIYKGRNEDGSAGPVSHESGLDYSHEKEGEFRSLIGGLQ